MCAPCQCTWAGRGKPTAGKGPWHWQCVSEGCRNIWGLQGIRACSPDTRFMGNEVKPHGAHSSQPSCGCSAPAVPFLGYWCCLACSPWLEFATSLQSRWCNASGETSGLRLLGGSCCLAPQETLVPHGGFVMPRHKAFIPRGSQSPLQTEGVQSPPAPCKQNPLHEGCPGFAWCSFPHPLELDCGSG